jgi:uncharacterized protein YaaQ
MTVPDNIEPGWLATAAGAIGIWLTKLLIGRHLNRLDDILETTKETMRMVEHVQDTVVKIDERVSKVEGRMRI